MDDADITEARAESDMLANLSNSRRPAGPAPSGKCHYCDEQVDPTARFCNHECRDGWEREQRRRLNQS
jgi:hypothetical protein